ncbi:MAG TPA: urea carboxylase-associated family protein [Stellaceae bacterium]|nr:urea carboxylase-associated family protein [Stellaceae bacterium]
MTEITIPARKGKATFATKGQTIRVINTHGQQVVDTWAFNRADLTEFMSMEHTRAKLLKIIPAPGDTMLTNRRRPILTFLEDNSGGIHDTLMAACDRYRYESLGVKGFHDSCTDNLAAALGALGLTPPETPSPLNLFMNIPVAGGVALSFEPAIAPPGSHVSLRAEMDLVIVFSSCPQDIIPINGLNLTPTEAHFEIAG